MTEPLSRFGGCSGCAAGAILGLLFGSLLAAMIVKAVTNLPWHQARPAAAGWSYFDFDPHLTTQIEEGACTGGFFGLIFGSWGGAILGRWMAAKLVAKVRENGGKGTLQANRAEPDALPDRPRDERFFER
jgi:hypothetical protein